MSIFRLNCVYQSLDVPVLRTKFEQRSFFSRFLAIFGHGIFITNCTNYKLSNINSRAAHRVILTDSVATPYALMGRKPEGISRYTSS